MSMKESVFIMFCRKMEYTKLVTMKYMLHSVMCLVGTVLFICFIAFSFFKLKDKFSYIL